MKTEPVENETVATNLGSVPRDQHDRWFDAAEATGRSFVRWARRALDAAAKGGGE